MLVFFLFQTYLEWHSYIQVFAKNKVIANLTSKFREFMSPAIIVYYLNEKK